MVDLRTLTGDADEMLELQRVLEEAPDYALRITGHPPGPAEAQSNFTILPPGGGYEDKFVFGLYSSGKMIGCVDLFRGYPDKRTAMLGLLLLSEREQRRGYGRAAYEKVEDFVRNWGGIEKIRIGIVGTNDHVIRFWEKMGFSETGERKPYRYDKVESETIIYEKAIISRKLRYTMRAALERRELEESWPTRNAGMEFAEEIGKLMERSYRGTIDDEGETLDQFVAETRATMGGKYGPFVPEASFCVMDEGKAVAATIVTIWKDKPLLAYSVTDPAHQGKGMGRFLIEKSMNALFQAGHAIVELGVTQGNVPAEHLYRKLGFERL